MSIFRQARKVKPGISGNHNSAGVDDSHLVCTSSGRYAVEPQSLSDFTDIPNFLEAHIDNFISSYDSLSEVGSKAEIPLCQNIERSGFRRDLIHDISEVFDASELDFVVYEHAILGLIGNLRSFNEKRSLPSASESENMCSGIQALRMRMLISNEDHNNIIRMVVSETDREMDACNIVLSSVFGRNVPKIVAKSIKKKTDKDEHRGTIEDSVAYILTGESGNAIHPLDWRYRLMRVVALRQYLERHSFGISTKEEVVREFHSKWEIRQLSLSRYVLESYNVAVTYVEEGMQKTERVGMNSAWVALTQRLDSKSKSLLTDVNQILKIVSIVCDSRQGETRFLYPYTLHLKLANIMFRSCVNPTISSGVVKPRGIAIDIPALKSFIRLYQDTVKIDSDLLVSHLHMLLLCSTYDEWLLQGNITVKSTSLGKGGGRDEDENYHTFAAVLRELGHFYEPQISILSPHFILEILHEVDTTTKHSTTIDRSRGLCSKAVKDTVYLAEMTTGLRDHLYDDISYSFANGTVEEMLASLAVASVVSLAVLDPGCHTQTGIGKTLFYRPLEDIVKTNECNVDIAHKIQGIQNYSVYDSHGRKFMSRNHEIRVEKVESMRCLLDKTPICQIYWEYVFASSKDIYSAEILLKSHWHVTIPVFMVVRNVVREFEKIFRYTQKGDEAGGKDTQRWYRNFHCTLRDVLVYLFNSLFRCTVGSGREISFSEDSGKRLFDSKSDIWMVDVGLKSLGLNNSNLSSIQQLASHLAVMVPKLSAEIAGRFLIPYVTHFGNSAPDWEKNSAENVISDTLTLCVIFDELVCILSKTLSTDLGEQYREKHCLIRHLSRACDRHLESQFSVLQGKILAKLGTTDWTPVRPPAILRSSMSIDSWSVLHNALKNILGRGVIPFAVCNLSIVVQSLKKIVAFFISMATTGCDVDTRLPMAVKTRRVFRRLVLKELDTTEIPEPHRTTLLITLYVTQPRKSVNKDRDTILKKGLMKLITRKKYQEDRFTPSRNNGKLYMNSTPDSESNESCESDDSRCSVSVTEDTKQISLSRNHIPSRLRKPLAKKLIDSQKSGINGYVSLEYVLSHASTVKDMDDDKSCQLNAILVRIFDLSSGTVEIDTLRKTIKVMAKLEMERIHQYTDEELDATVSMDIQSLCNLQMVEDVFSELGADFRSAAVKAAILMGTRICHVDLLPQLFEDLYNKKVDGTLYSLANVVDYIEQANLIGFLSIIPSDGNLRDIACSEFMICFMSSWIYKLTDLCVYHSIAAKYLSGSKLKQYGKTSSERFNRTVGMWYDIGVQDLVIGRHVFLEILKNDCEHIRRLYKLIRQKCNFDCGISDTFLGSFATGSTLESVSPSCITCATFIVKGVEFVETDLPDMLASGKLIANCLDAMRETESGWNPNVCHSLVSGKTPKSFR